ncbi:hypothetical protein [uncultured Alistipes sp.]|uniref:hypothetical protein n=1 Tax=uncultured Alistipes sp. TaxID=538949 RepID=UPI00259506C5|nr:hypothetical protein [uncultured Alistipes sp.]
MNHNKTKKNVSLIYKNLLLPPNNLPHKQHGGSYAEPFLLGSRAINPSPVPIVLCVLDRLHIPFHKRILRNDACLLRPDQPANHYTADRNDVVLYKP